MKLDTTKLGALPDRMRSALEKGPTSAEWKDAVRGVPAEDLRATASAMKDAATEPPSVRRESALEVRGEPFFHHGDLVVDGNLRIIAPFFVTGDVTVSGVLKDMGPDSKVGIAGKLRAAHLHTSGEFGCGDIECPDGVVYGHYNDNSLVARTIRARVVIGDEHDIQAEKVISPTHFDLDKYQQGLPENVRRKLRGIFVDGVFDEEGSLDHDKLFNELMNGKPVFHVATSTTNAPATRPAPGIRAEAPAPTNRATPNKSAPNKSAPRKAGPSKSSAMKGVSKRPETKKPATKESATKKPTSKKTTPKKTTPKKATPKKATPKKATPKKATPKKATPKKATPKKPAHKKLR